MSQTMDMIGTEQKDARSTALSVIRGVFAEKRERIERIILFGSRARGDYKADSDWDFLVISEKELAIKEKHRFITQIKRKLAKFGIPNDIIIQSNSRFNSMKKYPGNISYAAGKEGVST